MLQVIKGKINVKQRKKSFNTRNLQMEEKKMLKEELWKYFKNTGSIETYLLYKTMEQYKIESSKDLSQVLKTKQ